MLVAPALAAAPTHVEIPFELTVEDASLREPVIISGALYGILSQSQDNGSGVHAQMHYNVRGLKGTGEETGDSYKVVNLYISTANGVMPLSWPIIEDHWENTVVQHTLIVGPGANNRYILHSTFHITYDPNGNVVVQIGEPPPQ